MRKRKIIKGGTDFSIALPRVRLEEVLKLIYANEAMEYRYYRTKEEDKVEIHFISSMEAFQELASRLKL
ncbi:MAG: hypothetical protein HFJ33_05505 [Clostridia bacterium]|nr:hypothetical protein [Clostridia bacterium]